jgi:hypothetical protein
MNPPNSEGQTQTQTQVPILTKPEQLTGKITKKEHLMEHLNKGLGPGRRMCAFALAFALFARFLQVVLNDTTLDELLVAINAVAEASDVKLSRKVDDGTGAPMLTVKCDVKYIDEKKQEQTMTHSLEFSEKFLTTVVVALLKQA